MVFVLIFYIKQKNQERKVKNEKQRCTGGENMNPVFIFLVICGTVLLWFLLSFIFYPLGRLVYRLFKDAIDAMETGDKKESEEKLNEKR